MKKVNGRKFREKKKFETHKASIQRKKLNSRYLKMTMRVMIRTYFIRNLKKKNLSKGKATSFLKIPKNRTNFKKG